MSTKLSRNIRDWINRNRNNEIYQRLKNLTPLTMSSTQEVFDQWKGALSYLKKTHTKINRKARKEQREKEYKAEKDEWNRLTEWVNDQDEPDVQLLFEVVDTQKTEFHDGRSSKISVQYEPIEITPGTIDFLSAKISNKINNVVYNNRKVQKDKGFALLRTVAKILFYTQNPDEIKDDSISQGNKLISTQADEEITYQEVENKLKSLLEVHSDSKDYTCFFYKLEIWSTFSDRKKKRAGGCNNSGRETETFEKNGHFITNPRSAMNNCSFMIFNMFYDVKTADYRPNLCRAEMGIELNTMISIDQLPLILSHYNKKFNQSKGLIVTDEHFNVLYNTGNVDEDNSVKIMHIADHYYAIDAKNEVKHKLFKPTPDFIKQRSPKKSIKEQGYIYLKKREDEEKIDRKSLVFWKSVGSKSCLLYFDQHDQKILKEFTQENEIIDELLKLQNKIIITYNGAQNEYYQLARVLGEKKIEIDERSMLINDGRILRLDFGENNHILSLINFIPGKFEDAIHDFDIPWDTDVKMLANLFENVNDMIYELTKFNITSFLTIYQLAYNYWSQQMIRDKVFLEAPDAEKQKIIRSATFGGRCEAKIPNFKSKNYDDIINKKMSYDEVLKSKDCRRYTDISSLYPAAMGKFIYPTGKSYMSEVPDVEFQNGRLGFYEISFTAPDKLGMYILPARNDKGDIIYPKSGSGYYTSTDIRLALNYDYDICFIGKALVYDSKPADIFSEFVKTFYAMKNNNSENRTKRKVAKLILNSLYGNMSMKNKDKRIKLCVNGDQVEKMMFELDEVVDIEQVGSNILVSGYMKEIPKPVNRPIHLSAFILAYSRKIMVEQIGRYSYDLYDPYSYTDTDSLRISQKQFEVLQQKQCICEKTDAKLGQLVDELDGGLIINERNLGSKRYMIEYITPDGSIKEICKISGVPLDKQSADLLDGQKHVITYPSMSRNIQNFTTKTVQRTYTVQ